MAKVYTIVLQVEATKKRALELAYQAVKGTDGISFVATDDEADAITSILNN